jgi:hypothetical protein
MDYYFYNLSNVNVANDKVYFLLSRSNKEGKESKFMKCHEIVSPTIQNLLQTLHLQSINDLILLDTAQENEVNVLNIGVSFTNNGIDWSVVAKGYRQKYFGPYVYPQNFIEKWNLQKMPPKIEPPKEQSFNFIDLVNDNPTEQKPKIEYTEECPCNRKLKMPFWDEENCIMCKDNKKHNALDNIDKWAFLIPRIETKEDIKIRREKEKLEAQVSESGDIIYKKLPKEKQLNFDTNSDGSKNYRITSMSDLDNIGDNDYIVF